MGFLNDLVGWITDPFAQLVGGLIGGERRNDQQIAVNRENNEFNAQQAALQREWATSETQKNRDWQTTMSNTQYQRAIGDLKNAGLNPMLAYSQGGAGTPSGGIASGSSATSQTIPTLENTLTGAISNAYKGATAKEQVRQMRIQNDNLQAQGDLIRAQTRETESKADVNNSMVPYYDQSTKTSYATAAEANSRIELNFTTVQKISNEIMKIKMETEHEGVKIMATQAKADLDYWTMKYRQGEISLLALQSKAMQIANTLEGNKIPQSEAERDAWETEYGKKIRPYIGDITKGVSSASGFKRILPRR